MQYNDQYIYKDSLPIGLFDPSHATAHEQVFKLSKGDGFPERKTGFGIILISELDRKAATKDFTDAVPMQTCEFVIVQ